LALFAGGSNGCLGQARRQFSILAIRLVVQQIQVVFVFFQRQEDSDRLARCADDVPRSALAQGTDKIVRRVFAHGLVSPFWCSRRIKESVCKFILPH
jgi:hypothetical protein